MAGFLITNYDPTTLVYKVTFALLLVLLYSFFLSVDVKKGELSEENKERKTKIAAAALIIFVLLPGSDIIINIAFVVGAIVGLNHIRKKWKKPEKIQVIRPPIYEWPGDQGDEDDVVINVGPRRKLKNNVPSRRF